MNRLLHSSTWIYVLAGLALFGLLIATRWYALFLPPYWDYSFAFLEANYLLDSGFDYVTLFGESKITENGEAACYLVSITPTFLALLYMLTPSPKWVFFLYHLVIIAWSCVAILIFYSIVRRSVGWGLALVLAACVLTTPLFSVQIEMLGMEMPMIACGILIVELLRRERYLSISLVSTFAFLVKATGSIFTLVVIACLVGRCFFGWGLLSVRQRKYLLLSIGVNTLAFILQYGSLVLSGMAAAHFPEDQSPHVALALVRYWSWDLLAIFIATVVLAAFYVFKQLGIPTFTEAWTALREAFDKHTYIVFSWMFMFVLLVAIYRSLYCPRYLTVTIPFLYIVIADLIGRMGRHTLAWMPVFVVIIAFNVANRNGQFYTPVEDVLATLDSAHIARAGSFQERSHEYWGDHISTVRAVQAIEDSGIDAPIFAPMMFNFYVKLPRLGYVSQALNEYDTFGRAALDFEFEEVSRLIKDNPEEIIIITGIRPDMFHDRDPIYDPKRDTILYEDQLSPPLMVIHRRGPEDPAARQDWYCGWALPYSSRSIPYSIVERAKMLRKAGLSDRVVSELRESLREYPLEGDIRYQLAVALLVEGNMDEARETLFSVVRQSPKSRQAHAMLVLADLLVDPEIERTEELTNCLTALLHGEEATANSILKQHRYQAQGDPMRILGVAAAWLYPESSPAASLDPLLEDPQLASYATTLAAVENIERDEIGEALSLLDVDDLSEHGQFLRSIVLNQTGRITDANSQLQAIFTKHPNAVEARYYSALLQSLLGQSDESAGQLDLVIEADPSHLEAQYQLGVEHLRAGRTVEGRAYLERVLSQAPGFDAARRRLTELDSATTARVRIDDAPALSYQQ